MNHYINRELQQNMKLPSIEVDLAYIYSVSRWRTGSKAVNYFLQDTNRVENDLLKTFKNFHIYLSSKGTGSEEIRTWRTQYYIQTVRKNRHEIADLTQTDCSDIRLWTINHTHGC
jgi:hypothetical protein